MRVLEWYWDEFEEGVMHALCEDGNWHKLTGVYPVSMTFSDLDYTPTDVVEIEVTARYGDN